MGLERGDIGRVGWNKWKGRFFDLKYILIKEFKM